MNEALLDGELRSARDGGGASVRRFTYRDPDAISAGGIASIEMRRRDAYSYAVTVEAYGDLSAATSPMTAHILIGDQEWTATAEWTPTPGGWTAAR
jgi:hypothetical protein